ncbi:glycosyltransferase [uncultured Ilyobacter sp.]|uniref:glycosyltransferase family 2 protein n=1 Tax=uncultured Ilyobacter sp. TaxID=544433 RepID=UPI0029C03C7F|nr:glycosyltransferase [uncultured Ilyobacter sp.]
MSPKISVIVAAYNVEKYICRCLESLERQSLKEIEILIINDGSIDSTEKISNEFQKKDKRFKVITQQNGGLSAARNTGIEYARAKYIAFLDGDDFVEKSMYQTLYNKMTQDKSDLVICGFYKVWENEEFVQQKKKIHKFNKNLLKGDILQKFLSKHDEPFVVAWNKLYKKDLIIDNNIWFENRAFFEDIGFMARYLYYVSKISIVDDSLINYIQRDGSITRKYNPIIEESLRNTLKLIKEFCKKNKINNKYERHISNLETRLFIYYKNYSMRNRVKENFNLELSLSGIPLKHKLAVIALKLDIYEKAYKFVQVRKCQ